MEKKFIIFFLTHFTYGMLFNMFGPIVPYLSQATGKIQSQFTYIFVVRGICYLVAGFGQKSYLNEFCIYKRMRISCLVSGLCLLMFQISYSHYLLSSLLCLIMFLGHGSMQVLINVLLMTSSSEDAKKVISFSYGFYGIGSVMGSFIVSILGVNSLAFGGIIATGVGMLYFDQITFKNKQKPTLDQPIANQQISAQRIYMSPSMQMMFAVLFALYAAISLSFRSWFPSFVVMSNFASKQNAAISISMYSAVLTFFRFAIAFWNPNIVKSLSNVSSALIVTLSCSLGCYYFGMPTFLVYGSPIVLGMLFSSYTPYLYALPSQFKMSFTQQGTCNTIIAYAIGEAVVSAVIGCFMTWIHPIMLLIILLLFSLLNKFYIMRTIKQFSVSKRITQNPEEIQMKDVL